MNTQLTTNDSHHLGNISLDEIYERYHVAFVRYANKISSDVLFVEDIVQDVFLTLLQQTNYFVSEVVALKYIYRAIYNRCIDLIRHKQTMQCYEEICRIEALAASNIGELNNLLTEELFMIVEKRIKNLPPKCKRIFMLKYRNEYSNPEISAQLGLSIRTVENQMYIARNVLRRQVDIYLHSV